MSARNPVEKLTLAVLGLEQGLAALHGEVQGYANELVKQGDALARQLVNDIDVLVKSLVDEIKRELDARREAVRGYYEDKTRRELDKIKSQGEGNLDAAAKAVVEEIVRIASGVQAH